MISPADDRLIVGLDLPSVGEAEAAVQALEGCVSFYKIGYQFGYAGGLDFAGELVRSGYAVFLDLKLLDIDSTVARGVESVARLGAAMLTVHAYPKAMRAAVEAARGTQLRLLAVTVLTSMDAADLEEAGYRETPVDLVMRRAREARAAGMGGIVCAPGEAAAVRRIVGSDLSVVTPGIRPAGAPLGGQKRVMTPRAALEAGASHIVVARPIVDAPDRRAAAQAILADMRAAGRESGA